MDPVPFTIAVAVSTALVGAILALWRRQIVTDRKNDAREAAATHREEKAAERCANEVRQAVERIQFLENRSYGDQQNMINKCLATIDKNSSVFAQMVELEKAKQTGSGQHPIVRDV